MSGGFFQVVLAGGATPSPLDKEAIPRVSNVPFQRSFPLVHVWDRMDFVWEAVYEEDNLFIPKERIVAVRRFDTASELRYASRNIINDYCPFEEKFPFYADLHELRKYCDISDDCQCDMRQYISGAKPPPDGHEDAHLFINCKCALPNLFPIYIVTTVNVERHVAAVLDSRRHIVYKFIPETICYMVHPCERDRMKRFLQDSPNPVADLVQELRYNPTIGIETRAARERFESSAKRQRRADE